MKRLHTFGVTLPNSSSINEVKALALCSVIDKPSLLNVIARLEYELAYYDSAVQRFNHYPLSVGVSPIDGLVLM